MREGEDDAEGGLDTLSSGSYIGVRGDSRPALPKETLTVTRR